MCSLPRIHFWVMGVGYHSWPISDYRSMLFMREVFHYTMWRYEMLSILMVYILFIPQCAVAYCSTSLFNLCFTDIATHVVELHLMFCRGTTSKPMRRRMTEKSMLAYCCKRSLILSSPSHLDVLDCLCMKKAVTNVEDIPSHCYST